MKDRFKRVKTALQQFQSRRLNKTYADLQSDSEYSAIGHFFFNRLYGPQDFSFRDNSIRKLHKVLDGAVYNGMLTAVTQVIRLHELTDNMDNMTVEKMLAEGIGTDIDLTAYGRIYRETGTYSDRVEQIELAIAVTHTFYRLSQKWVVGASLKTVHFTAKMLGMGRIMAFINDGYNAFRKIKHIDTFTETIDRREKAWHEKLWNGNGTGSIA